MSLALERLLAWIALPVIAGLSEEERLRAMTRELGAYPTHCPACIGAGGDACDTCGGEGFVVCLPRGGQA